MQRKLSKVLKSKMLNIAVNKIFSQIQIQIALKMIIFALLQAIIALSGAGKSHAPPPSPPLPPFNPLYPFP